MPMLLKEVDLGRKVEHKDGEVEDANARDDQVYYVEKGLPPNLQVEENVWEKRG